MSDTDPEVLFEDLTDDVPPEEDEDEHGEIPEELMQLHLELEAADVTAEEFAEAFGDHS